MSNKIIKMSDEQYFSTPGLSNSYLKIFYDRGPKYAQMDFKKTKAMKTGLAIHDFILQPDEFEKLYIVADEGIADRRKKEYKDFVKENPDKEILLYNEFKPFKFIKSNIMNYDMGEMRFFELFKDSQNEMAIFWDDEDFLGKKTLQMKGKMDMWIPRDTYNIIVDLKKCQNCMEFAKSIKQYKYHRQAALYLDGLEVLTGKPGVFYFMAFEYEYPHGVKMFQLEDSYIEIGRTENMLAIEKYRNWDGQVICYEDGVDIVHTPNYY